MSPNIPPNIPFDNRALSKLIVGGHAYYDDEQHKNVTPEPATLEVGMTEADFSNNNLGPGGAIIICAWMSYKDNGALSVLNLASNNLGALVLPAGWTHQEGLRGDVYKDIDGREQRNNPGKPEGIIAIANAIPDMRAMTSLNLASNVLGVEGAKAIAACLPKCT
jgi:hypothetical protein